MGDQISTMNIYRKLSAIQTELSAVAKNLTVGVGKSQYKAGSPVQGVACSLASVG